MHVWKKENKKNAPQLIHSIYGNIWNNAHTYMVFTFSCFHFLYISIFIFTSTADIEKDRQMFSVYLICIKKTKIKIRKDNMNWIERIGYLLKPRSKQIFVARNNIIFFNSYPLRSIFAFVGKVVTFIIIHFDRIVFNTSNGVLISIFLFCHNNSIQIYIFVNGTQKPRILEK